MNDICFEILEQNDIGAVATCDQCDQLHIEIGAFTSVLNKDAFSDICTYLTSMVPIINDLLVKTPSSEKVLIPVGSNNFLSLTESEFYKVTELFQMAHHMLCARNILQL